MAISFQNLKIISFDAVGTLIFPSPSVGAVYARVLARFRITLQPELVEHLFRDAFVQALKTKSRVVSERTERMFWRDVVYKAICRFCKEDEFDQIFDAIYEEFSRQDAWQIAEDAFDTLNELNARGFRIIVITNADARVRKVLKESPIGPSIEKVFLSTEIGVDKPSPDIFRHVANELNVEQQYFLHIGDDEEADAHGAFQAGWATLHLSQDSAEGNFQKIQKLKNVLPLLPDLVHD